MLKGILFALSACFVWGLFFITPQLMEDFTSIEISLGGYLFYGIASLAILLKKRLKGICYYSCSMWSKALCFAFVSSIGYYTCLVTALRYSSPAICAIVLGISPITITFYGNLKHRAPHNKSILLSSILIILGLLIINIPHFEASNSPIEYALGLTCSLLALLSWSWYAVENSQFLKNNPQIAPSDWSTIVGVATLVWVIAFSLILFIFFKDTLEIPKHLTINLKLMRFFMGCAIIGLLCSWLGAVLWNQASFNLPISLAAQLTIFETIFGLIFVYTFEQHLPAKTELIGVIFLISAVVYAIRNYNYIPQQAIP